MPPRNPELPEGTDHIINGAMDTGGDSGGGDLGGGLGSGGSGGTGGGAAAPGGTGFVGSGGSDDTGGTAGGGGNIVETLKGQTTALRGQATDRVREFAEGGKSRVTDALDELARVVGETADSIDERLGAEYGGYARRAATAVTDFSGNLRAREVDEIYDGAREVVRKSPGIAIAAAAVVGFAIARLIKAGIPVEGERGSGGGSSKGGSSGGGGAGTGV